MLCPFCNSPDTQVKDSRNCEAGKAIRRRRICPECDSRFTTFERARLKDLYVIKRSGVKKKLDQQKIINSIKMAIRKRNIGEYVVEKIAEKVVSNVESSVKGEISTERIGETIMRELAAIDQISYIRFASVYKDFTSSQDFIKFINKLEKN